MSVQLNIEWAKCNNFDKHCSVYSGAGFKVKHAKGIVQECLRSFPYIWVSVNRILIMVDTLWWLLHWVNTTWLFSVCECQLHLCFSDSLNRPWWCFALQFVSDYWTSLLLKPADNDCSHYPRMWVAAVQTVPHGILSLADIACPWLSRMWVIAILAVFQACWQFLSLALQPVSTAVSHYILNCSKWPFLALQDVSGCYTISYCILSLPTMAPWLSREWVTAMPHCILSLLTMPILDSPESDYYALLHSKPTDTACSWLSRMWVAVMHCCISSLLMMPIITSIGSEHLHTSLHLKPWWHLFLAL